MKRGVFVALVAFLVCPALASAAGFARESLFLSRAPVTEGESVTLYAPVMNIDTSAWSGSVVFSDAGDTIGSVSASLKAGEARVVSVSWTPAAAGSHNITATLQKDGGVIDTLSATFNVSAQPAPQSAASAADSAASPAESAAAVQSSQVVKDWLGNISPAVEGTLAPIINTIDPVRQAASNLLEDQLAATKPKLPQGNVLGATSEHTADASGTSESKGTFTDAVIGILWTVYFYLLTIVNFLLINAAVFYPVLALLFLYGLWRLYRRMTARSYE